MFMLLLLCLYLLIFVPNCNLSLMLKIPLQPLECYYYSVNQKTIKITSPDTKCIPDKNLRRKLQYYLILIHLNLDKSLNFR